MWPTFVLATLIDGLLIHRLSPVGQDSLDLVLSLLVATFGNIVLIGAVGPWLGRRIWKRRPAAAPSTPPKAQLEVLIDRIGTGLLVAGTFGLLVAGLANRPTIVVETEQRERGARLLEQYVHDHPDEELLRNLEASDTRRYADGYYRSCIPHDDRERWTCFIIDVRKQPGTIDRDRSELPNRPEP